MLVNVTLIPYLLGILANVSKSSTFDPEYLYEVKQTRTEYGRLMKSTELTSTITCQSFLSKNLLCNLHDLLFVTTNYNNFDDKFTNSNLIQVSSWFKMEFGSHGIHTTRIRYNTYNNMTKNFIKDIIDQFNINIGIRTPVLYSGSIDDEDTLKGACTTTYNVHITYKEEDANKEMDSNFQIRFILENFSDKKGLEIKDLHILKNRKNCNYSQYFEDWYEGTEMIRYVHMIEVIDKKLKIFTKLDGQRPFNPSGTIMFTETTELNLINFRSHKTMSFKDANLGPDIP